MLTAITKEKSRFSDKERAIAVEALRTLEPSASARQIADAGKIAINTMTRAADKLALELTVAIGADLNSLKGITAAGDVLIKNGYTEEQAVAQLQRLRNR